MFTTLIACEVVAAQTNSERRIPCKTQANESSCYWTHGRLNFYNGNPAFRIWKTGTHRLLGIYSGPSTYRTRLGDIDADDEHPEFPSNVRRKFKPTENWIFADFEVCPLEPEKPGAMQAACIESATNVVVKK